MNDDKNTIIAERMSNVAQWEFYRFSDDETDAVVCKIALCADETNQLIEYGVWRADDGEPSATGTIEWRFDEWDDGAREDALARITHIYEEELPEIRNGIAYGIRAVDEDDDVESEDDIDDEEARE